MSDYTEQHSGTPWDVGAPVNGPDPGYEAFRRDFMSAEHAARAAYRENQRIIGHAQRAARAAKWAGLWAVVYTVSLTGAVLYALLVVGW